MAVALAALGSVCSAARASTFRLTAVACPSVSQCTAVDSSGGEVSFKPSSPGRHLRHRIDFTRWLVLGAIACPSAHECVAVDRVAGRDHIQPELAGPSERRED